MSDLVDQLFTAFEVDGGGCAHDLGLSGLLAIIEAWEKVRSPENLKSIQDEFRRLVHEENRDNA